MNKDLAYLFIFGGVMFWSALFLGKWHERNYGKTNKLPERDNERFEQ